ncbi:extracellular solute-binding protein [Paenibacillus hemerocallicola]|nr:extracellular solute-binding protein [Paenibacillus hemerocallicola]
MMRRRPTKEQFMSSLEEMIRALRSEIIEGTYAPGDYLPPERQLAAKFGMSNNSLRAGLELLADEGWIEKVPRVGNRVAMSRPRVKLKLACTWTPFRNMALSEQLEHFHRLYPWITVETADINYRDKTELFSNDLIMLENTQFYGLVEDGEAFMLEPLAAKPELFPKISDLFCADGRLWMQPIIFSPIVLCYNKAHFRERGMLEPDGSWTWDDLVRHAELLSDGKGRYGFFFHVPALNRWPVFLLQSGERFEWEDGKLRSLYGTKMLESMKVSKRILHNRKAFPMHMSEDNDDSHRMFLEGKISMTLTSYMGLNVWNDTDLEYDISPAPYTEELRTLLISMGLGISSRSRHKEEAQLFVDFLTSGEAQVRIRDRTMSIPSLGTVPGNTVPGKMNRPSRYMQYRETMSSFRTLRDLNMPMKAMKELEKQLKAYWADMMDEEELCSRLSSIMSGHPVHS